jgi:hypothetical protein
MTLIPLLAAVLLVSSLTATMLAASGALARLGGDRRAAVEASLVLESMLAKARVEHAELLNTLAPGEQRVLPVGAPPGWTVTATASREAHGELLWLQVVVARSNDLGQLQAGQRGTLILARTMADTAIVIDSRPRF